MDNTATDTSWVRVLRQRRREHDAMAKTTELIDSRITRYPETEPMADVPIWEIEQPKPSQGSLLGNADHVQCLDGRMTPH